VLSFFDPCNLPKPSKAQKVEHHPALDYRQAPEFMKQLQQIKGNPARCLEFTILTAVRAENALGATWDEFNLDEKLWVIPAQRMKVQQGGRVARDHIVPLTDACLSLLKQMQNSRVNEWVFSGTSKVKRKGGLSENAMATVLKRMGKADITAHGFRSTFSDYIAEQTSHSPEAREICLAHVVKNAAEAAYRRGDMLDKRWAIMRDWADYLYSSHFKVVYKNQPVASGNFYIAEKFPLDHQPVVSCTLKGLLPLQ
jgi:integrase